MDLKLYALLTGKIKKIPKGEPGLPSKVTLTNPDHSNHNLFNNSHIELVSDENKILSEADIMLYPELDEFGVPADKTKSAALCLTINIPSDDFTVTFYPGDYEILWSGAEPVFTAGHMYYISFVTLPGKKLLGAWAEVNI